MIANDFRAIHAAHARLYGRTEKPVKEDTRPEGVGQKNGAAVGCCVVCGEWTPISVPLFLIPKTGYRHYCMRNKDCAP